MLCLFNGTSESGPNKLATNIWASYEYNYHEYFNKFLKMPM